MIIALAIAATVAKTFYAGGDPTEIAEVEASGAIYKVHGKPTDPFVAMKTAGWTAIRLRVWNEPKDKFCDKPHTLALAKRAYEAGLKIMIDFHYSDWWADPGKQNKPAAWKDLSQIELNKAVHEFSRDIIASLVAQGTPAEVVQPGNEVTNGMLWPEGRLNINLDGWDNFMRLTKSAIKGIREGAGIRQPKIMAHIDQGGRNSVSRFWLDNYFAKGGEADIIGLSYYPMWHGTMDELKSNLNWVARTYKRDVLVAETAFPYRGWNETTRAYDENATPVKGLLANPSGQDTFLRRIVTMVKSVPNGRGVGVLWWAPAWIGKTGQGGGWERLTLFDNQSGEALPAFWAFGKPN